MIIWDELKRINNNYLNEIDEKERRENGIYYTSIDLAYILIEELFETLPIEFIENIENKKILEPCVGTGDFIFAYLKYIDQNFELTKAQRIKLINNIYVSDSDNEALEIYFRNLQKLCKEKYKISLSEKYKNNIGNNLIFDFDDSQNVKYVDIKDYFGEIKFDLIITNPPYKNLREEIRNYKDDIIDYKNNKLKNKSLRTFIEDNYPLSRKGSINLYEIFVEEILKTYLKTDGFAVLLIPNGFLSNKTTYDLRTYVLKNKKIKTIIRINENNIYIDANQALSALILKNSERTDKIKIIENVDKRKDFFYIKIENILCEYTFNSISIANESEYLKLEKMNRHKRLKEIDYIVNMRGELDVSLEKNSYSTNETKYKLVRGRNISRYNISIEDIDEYVLEDFVNNSAKGKYITSERIVCQQVVNMNKNQRLSFSYIDKDFILANSCNFISVLPNDDHITLYYLLGLFNTKLMNWYFKKYSSNNHINNYELDALPIPTEDTNSIILIDKLVRRYLKKKDEKILNEIEDLVEDMFYLEKESNSLNKDNTNIYLNKIKKVSNASDEDILSLIEEDLKLNQFCKKYNLDRHVMRIVNSYLDKYKYEKKNYIMNHNKYKLSDLDLEMIENIPQGGNWRDIPQSTINKSKRLINIQKDGGRTTLYGRIDYDEPSYTITTYFNRPGNGTYVHPIHDRVISAREGARFQSFRDDYSFLGTQKDILNQIGNAVPPLFAYQLGKQIKEKTGLNKSIDLFSGAGGFVAGFKEAGINSVICNDNDISACNTLKVNNPELNILLGDIQKKETKKIIIDAGLESNVDIICGGPPCQGFSLAGYRDKNDDRNQLYRDFFEVIKKVKPKLIIFENVKGLLSMRDGMAYKEIITVFENIGYELEGRVLSFDDYGIPQKRERIILIGVLKELDIHASELFPEEITSEFKITAKATIGDLEDVLMDEDAMYIDYDDSLYMKYLKNKISFSEYIDILKTKDSKYIKKEKDRGQLSFL